MTTAVEDKSFREIFQDAIKNGKPMTREEKELSDWLARTGGVQITK